jgi:coenzyme Q-binding protein COQ10
MIRHSESRILPHTPAEVFDLVADVERYPEFLPWVIGARILRRAGNTFDAEVLVGFKMIRERYTSHVVLERPERIEVRYTHGPFRHLINRWQFAPVPEGCKVDFYIEFEFRSRILQKLIGGLFSEAVRKMVAAFEIRARTLYGTQKPARAVPDGRPA